MGKKMIVNCAVCDARKVNEETLAAYESVTINASMILSDVRSRALLDKYPVAMNCASVLDLEEDVAVSTINGHSEIKSSDIPNGKRFLLVNGSLTIGAGTERVLESCVGIQVNGSVTYPESLSGYLSRMKVNGSTTCYPDGAILLKRSAVIDRTFALRAKNSLYWSERRLIMVDPALDPAALAAKGAAFSSQEAVIAESKVEGLIGLIDEACGITIVPDGTAVIRDDVELSSGVLKKYGPKLYIIGDLRVDQDAAEALAQVEYLVVKGDVAVYGDLREELEALAQEIGGDVTVIRAGRCMRDLPMAKISAWMLEREPDGVHVEDCAMVKLDADISRDLIMEKLTISDCAVVSCSEEQEDAVTAVSEDVAKIGGAGGEGLGEVLKKMAGDPDTKVVNASEYVL